MNQNYELLLKFSLPTIILLGLAKTSAYYNQFHLPILEYLSFSEMTMLFLNSIYVYSGLFFHFAIFFLLDNKHFRGSLTLIVLASLFITIFNALSGNFKFLLGDILLVVSGIILVTIIIIGISKKSVAAYIRILDKTTQKIYAAVFALFTLLVISSFQGKIEAAQVKKDHIYSGTSIIYTGGNAISNDTCYFIGKTNDFIFFYNELDRSVKVYPMREIESITYRTQATY